MLCKLKTSCCEQTLEQTSHLENTQDSCPGLTDSHQLGQHYDFTASKYSTNTNRLNAREIHVRLQVRTI